MYIIILNSNKLMEEEYILITRLKLTEFNINKIVLLKQFINKLN